MVKIAVAGAGAVAKEIIAGLLARNKHQLIILTRKDPPSDPLVRPDVTYVKVNYQDKNQLANVLRGVHTVLSFIAVQTDTGNSSQKNLIDAAVVAGVKRFAPSEWALGTISHTPYSGKADVREYLRQLNQKEKVLEYTLFQPGIFLNYLGYPYKTSEHLALVPMPWDFQNRRAIVLEGHEHEDAMTMTLVQDVANVVAEAIEFEGEWPVVGGISGNRVTVAQLLELGKRVRGQSFEIEAVKLEVQAGELKTSWVPLITHRGIPEDQIETISRDSLKGTLTGIAKGVFVVTDEWNRLLPSYRFTNVEEFLSKVWTGKP
ncbi:unnamed protein product [Somion occarium]|uniref:NmrA-like domain-containing protein n=1 Tax=Somion occarium TaxID=3059160 RepID=A0ABP1DHL6_9APHY